MSTTDNSQNHSEGSERTTWANISNDDVDRMKSLGPGIKICPKCRTPMERSSGSNIMTCAVCHHQFCWMCGKDWSLHKEFFNCPYYKREEDPFI